MSVTVGRAKVVDFTEPYYYDCGSVAVMKDSPIQSLSELNGGKTFCVGTATTYEQWLTGTLEIVDPNIVPAPTTPRSRRCRPTTSASRPSRPGARTMRSSPTATASRMPSTRAPRSASSKARRSSPSPSRSPSTRAARTRPRSGHPQRDRHRDACRRHPQGFSRSGSRRTSPQAGVVHTVASFAPGRLRRPGALLSCSEEAMR